MATIRDVAVRAGVSTATVSRVINHSAYVEPETITRVEKAMRELGYRRNQTAHALARRSGKFLGLLTGNLADPFFARLARGVEETLHPIERMAREATSLAIRIFLQLDL